jgi:uncharacterized SAM-binding protein YcdF (DUF218 family)
VQALDRSSSLLPRLSAWLSCADPLCPADVIFVLAGRRSRKEYGLELFREGLAPGILFSVARFEIRRFSKMPLPVPFDLLKLAQGFPPPLRHFFVLFEGQKVQVEHVFPRRFGTLTEIAALAHWLKSNPQIHSLLIISSATHLRRLRMCCRSLLGAKYAFALIAATRSSTSSEEEPQGVIASTAAALLELLKLLLYWALLKLLRPSPGMKKEP